MSLQILHDFVIPSFFGGGEVLQSGTTCAVGLPRQVARSFSEKLWATQPRNRFLCRSLRNSGLGWLGRGYPKQKRQDISLLAHTDTGLERRKFLIPRPICNNSIESPILVQVNKAKPHRQLPQIFVGPRLTLQAAPTEDCHPYDYC